MTISGKGQPQFQQLKMFMTPNEVHAEYAPLEGDKQTVDKMGKRESDSQLWDRKLSESKGQERNWRDSKLHSSIAEGGVQNPVHLGTDRWSDTGKREIVGGHHRIAAQTDIDPDRLMPVLHHENMQQAKSMSAKQGVSPHMARQGDQSYRYT